MLSTANLKDGSYEKFSDKWSGPHKVIGLVGNAALKLKLPVSWASYNIHPIFHVSLVKPYTSSEEFVGRPSPKEKLFHDDKGHLSFKYFDILDSRVTPNNLLEYLVTLNPAPGAPTRWISKIAMQNPLDAEAFHREYPEKPNVVSTKRRR